MGCLGHFHTSVFFCNLGCLLLSLATGQWVSLGLLPPEEENVPMMKVETVSGMLTNLPCNITPSVPGDRVLIVLWYKDGYGKPIYSFDLRDDSPESEGLLWANEDGGDIPRAQLNVKSQPTAFLSLLGVEERDGGIYRCRVDFKKSPTRFWKVDLTVIVPPTTSVLLDEKGTEVEGKVGPYNEGATLVLTCDILGGWPSSEVTWWRDGAVIDDTWEEISPGKSRNTMKLEHLNRDNLNTELECQGSNNNHTQPVITSLYVLMNLPPLDVQIFQAEPGPLSADNSYTFHCHSHGARPGATLSWFDSHGNRLIAASHQVSDDGNSTVSTLKYAPSVRENEKSLRCRAENPVLAGSIIENIITLEVSYFPQLWLRLGQNLAQDKIKEGDDVYFDCEVSANPRIHKLVWKHDGEIIKSSPDNGFIMNEGNLIIQSVKRGSTGLYSCHATNSEGSGNSNVVSLIVQYAPVCLSQGQAVGVAKGEESRVVCQVDSNPPPTNFKWQFNTSTELRNIPASNVFNDETQSVAQYVPMTELDYGSLLCWGINELGKQEEPCVFSILPAGKPDPVSNCSVDNRTYTAVIVSCQPGYDGGVAQQFVLEIIPSAFFPTLDIQNKIESIHYPQFRIENLPAGTEFKVVVYAKNEKGFSEKTEVRFWTMRIATEIGEKRILPATHDGPVPVKVTPIVWIFMAIISVLVLMIILIGLILRARCSESKRQKAKFVRAGGQSSTLLKDGANGRGNNPDLIPETVGLTNIEGDMRHIEDKTDNVWLLKRRSICLPGNPSKYSSFALSPSAHSSRDFQQNGTKQLPSGYYCTLPRNLSHSRSNVQISRNSSFEKSIEEIGQYTQKTLPHPRRREPDLRLLEPISYTSARNGHNPEIIAPVPPQFADSSPEEFSKSSENVAAKIDMTMTRF